MSKKQRLNKIIQLISDNVISTQDELRDKLSEIGFKTTQATISRDIKELNLIKTTRNGKYMYSVGNNLSVSSDVSIKFNRIFKDAVISIDYAENMVVINCYTGTANAACTTLDSIVWDGVVGTLAGDDTIFIVTRSKDCSAKFTTELKHFLGR